VDGAHRAGICTREAETEVVVAVRRLVPVAVRRAAVVGFVVPGAAADHPVGARVPSAGEDARIGNLPAQAERIAMRHMGEETRRTIAQGIHIQGTE